MKCLHYGNTSMEGELFVYSGHTSFTWDTQMSTNNHIVILLEEKLPVHPHI